jgi:hypothetical protein
MDRNRSLPRARAARHSATALALAVGLAGCQQAPAPAGGVNTAPQRVRTTSLPLPAPVVAGTASAAPCARLGAIKDPPNPITSASDPAYAAIKLAGRDALPCLVDAIASTAPLDDPQTTPGGSPFTQGDLAFFLLVDFGYVDFASALPPDLRAEGRERGAFAYFDWIDGPGHRAQLQAEVRRQLEAQGTLAARAGAAAR